MTDHQKTKIAEMRKAGCGYSEISKALSVSRDTVKTFCRRNNITVDSTEEPKEAAGICPECGKPITQISGRKPKRFCSPECRQKWWNAHPERVGQKAVYEYAEKGYTSAFDCFCNFYDVSSCNHRRIFLP